MENYQWMILLMLPCLPYQVLSNHIYKDQRSGTGDCPNSEDILPCICYIWFGSTVFSCSKANSEEEIRAAFTAHFPSKVLDTFEILDNEHIKELNSNVFNGVAFKEFLITRNKIEKVSMMAFEDSSEIVTSIQLMFNKIEQFSFETEKSFPHLGSIQIGYNKLTEFPFESLKNFPNLWTFDIEHNPLGSIPVESFQKNSIERLEVSSTVDGELIVGTFANQTRMEWLWASYNNLINIPEGLFVTGSSQIDSLYLTNNGIVSIEPNAFDLVPGLTIYLHNNSLTTIEESLWRAPFESGVEIILSDDNPLECGCNVAWCVGDPALKHQVDYTWCQDGRAFQDLTPDDFVDS